MATTVERNIFQSFQNITPGGNHAFTLVKDITLCRSGTVTASAQSFSRFETDQVLIALGELADAAKDLQRNAEDRKREPAKEHKHPVQRSNEQFLHEPEGVTPFIEPDVRENHERADEQENISNRPALGGEGRKPRPRIHEAAHADDDIHRVAHIEHYPLFAYYPSFRRWTVIAPNIIAGGMV